MMSLRIHGLLQPEFASDWRSRVIAHLAEDSESALHSLQHCAGLRFENLREPTTSRTPKLDFGRVRPTSGQDSRACPRTCSIVLRNTRPDPVILKEIITLPDSDRFELQLVSPSLTSRLKPGMLSMSLAANSAVQLRVIFKPTLVPGFYDQWLLLRFEVSKTESSLYHYTVENAVLGMLACATCLRDEDWQLLWNVEAKPFVPGWLRSIFSNELVKLPGLSDTGSMGSLPPYPAGYPAPACAMCGQGLWDAFCVADKRQRAKANWDGIVHYSPVCAHLFHSRCLLRQLRPPPPFQRVPGPLSCPECGAAMVQAQVDMLEVAAHAAIMSRNRQSINSDNSLFVQTAQTALIRSVASYQQRFMALLDAEDEQIEHDMEHLDMFEVNRIPGRGVLNEKGKLRMYTRQEPLASSVLGADVSSAVPSAPGTETHTFLELHVPGILERRPALVYGDAVRLRFSAFSESVLPFEYVGFVHSVVGRTRVRLCVPAAVSQLLTEPALRFFDSLRYVHVMQGNAAALAALDASYGRTTVKGKREASRVTLSGDAEQDVRWREPLWMHVRFTSQKHQMAFARMRHAVQALSSYPHLAALLFPQHVGSSSDLRPSEPRPATPGIPCPKWSCIEAMLRDVGSVLNPEQGLVIERMLAPTRSTEHALLVFGPPGTGKTMTLVEGVLTALCTRGPDTRILCCAPSDSAADVLVQRISARAANFSPRPPAFVPWANTGTSMNAPNRSSLSQLCSNTAWMLRLNHFVRDIEDVRPDVVPFCAQLDPTSNRFQVPSIDELRRFPILVTTCATSALLHDRGLLPGHFDFIIIDEAAQALEPETLIPLSLKAEATQVLLAGDWKQLGPVVRSRCSDSLGLGISLLQRLATHASYQQLDCMGIVKLRRNYRCHAELLELPSALFYDNALVAAADPAVTHGLLGAARKIVQPLENGMRDHAAAGNTRAVGVANGAQESLRKREQGETSQHQCGAWTHEQEAHSSRKQGKNVHEQADEGARTDAGDGAGLGVDAEEVAEAVLWDEEEGSGAEDAGEEAEVEQAQVSNNTPLLFFGVHGRDMSEDESPSFYNPIEALAVRTLIQRLIGGDMGVSTNDIGVIAPYRKQVQKIRLLLRAENLGAVRVGTVDDYQGQEERVIVISTTLSNSERLELDSDSSLGFLSNERRFNVAITRATSLCIIVGNPMLMLAKPHWKSLLQRCISRDAYAGCPAPLCPLAASEAQDEFDEDAEMEALHQRMQEHMLALGAGSVPKQSAQVLENFFRDEQEFRVLV